MKILHFEPGPGPHSELLEELSAAFPSITTVATMPRTPRVRSQFLHHRGFIRKTVRKERPNLVVVHWDRGLKRIQRALWGKQCFATREEADQNRPP